MSSWSLYIIECKDGSLYTGVASNVYRRFNKHNRGRGAKYTRGRGPLKLVLEREVGDRGRAQQVEHKVKQLSRENKKRLVTDQAFADQFFLAA